MDDAIRAALPRASDGDGDGQALFQAAGAAGARHEQLAAGRGGVFGWRRNAPGRPPRRPIVPPGVRIGDTAPWTRTPTNPIHDPRRRSSYAPAAFGLGGSGNYDVGRRLWNNGL